MKRMKLSGPALLLSIALSWSAITHALIDHTLSLDSMLLRVGLAMFFAMAAVETLSFVVDRYRLQNALRRNREEAANARRRADDELTHHS